MNKKVIYYDGKVVVEDENGKKREVVSCDNLDDILVQENLIETIQNTLNSLEDSSSSYAKYKLRNILCIPAPVIETILVPSIMMYMTNDSIVDGMIYTRFGLMDREKFLAIFIGIFLPCALYMSKKYYEEYSSDKRSENGRILTIRELKNILLTEKNRLQQMKERSKTVEIEKERSYHINDEAVLETLQEYILLYYDIGYNFEEYYRYYTLNGDLSEDLKREYNQEGVKIIKKILEKSSANFTKKY